MGLTNIAILLYLRLWLIFPALLPLVFETHGNKSLTEKIKTQAKDVPVIFENSYRMSSMYAFYSGDPSFSVNNINYRQNQYSLDDAELKFQHRNIFYISRYLDKGGLNYRDAKGVLHYGKYISNFQSYRKLKTFVDTDKVALNESKELILKIYNPYVNPIELDKLKFGVAYMNAYKQFKELVPITPVPEKSTSILRTKDTTRFKFRLPKPELASPGYFKVSISENELPFGLNGENIKLD